MRSEKLEVKRKIVTIQGILQEAIKKITDENTKVVGATRTDAGVHALEQIASFKTHSKLETDVLKRALNANLPPDIRILDIAECPEDFHPRFSAKSKIYSYIISHAKDYPVFLRKYSWQLPYQLNYDSMQEAARHLIGRHDFSSFRASGCGAKSTIRRIFTVEVSLFSSFEFMTFKFDVPIIKINIEADAFLRHMARNIVGTLVEVGRGKMTPQDIVDILKSRDRDSAGPTAPAQGLFLEKIIYK
jgi:tRNA pseudouridine38-40 synthase